MPGFLVVLILLVLGCSIYVLVRLCMVDLKDRILPDVYVAAFALLGAVFHATVSFAFEPPLGLIEGAALGGGLLYTIRALANWHYKQDALGLGDVKLMAAAGIWLGPADLLVALTLGAGAGVAHGLGAALYHRWKTKQHLDLRRLQIPAGPGFIAGIIAAAFLKFQSLPGLFWP